ncbi:MAG: hypothetical protein LBH65_03885 [Desulfovibrio sp.]|jgi:hypothetical protein|nr:hypothetical protein [Desulfovibrio sp.]
MHNPLPTAFRLKRALVIAGSESSVRTDARALRAMGVGALVHCRETDRALALLEKESLAVRRSRKTLPTPLSPESTGLPASLDVVICDEHCGDTTAFAFAGAMARRRALRVQPLLVLSSSAESAKKLRDAGVTVLERPYAERDLRQALKDAMSPLRRPLNPKAFSAPEPEKKNTSAGKKPENVTKGGRGPMTTSDWFARGLEHLRGNGHDAAGEAFTRVLERSPDHVGAAVAMARVCRARRDANGTARYLLRAVAASRRAGDRQLADTIAAMLPAVMRDKIFVYEALGRLEEGAYREAASSFLEAVAETPETPLHRIIARACLTTEKPDESMSRLCDALEGLGHKVMARALRRRLLNYQPYVMEERASWLDRFPRLKEAVDVASYTAWAWKQA